MVRANPDNRLVKPLTELLLLSWGRCRSWRGVRGPVWSRASPDLRLLGGPLPRTPGKPPHDVDVLVVGQPSREDVYAAADQAQQRLGMPVNPVIRTEDAWRLASDPLVQQIQSSPVVEVLVPDDSGTSGPPPATGRSGDA